LYLEAMLKEYYGFGLEVTHFGKPEVGSYLYAQSLLQSQLAPDHEISSFYMIGDNPAADIEGGKRMGWTTFLVKTGIYKDGNDPNGATFIVNDLHEAVSKIFELEHLNVVIQRD